TSRTFPDTPSGETLGLAIDPDGDVWFTNKGANFVGYIANAAHHTIWFPLYLNTGSYSSRLTLHNPSEVETAATIIAYAVDGEIAGTRDATLLSKGRWTEDVGVMFPGAALGALKVISNGRLDGSVLLKDGSINLAVTPGKPTEGAELAFSRVVMPDATPTLLALSNPGWMNS
ncbi:MAG: hypothetical protein GY859_33815, partial [Desulfobacterales bacterium]|nr:hypothetical protein [Desulfobacterales bacterium]